MNLENKKVLLVGLAKTGVSTIKKLDKLGANILVNDIKSKDKLEPILMELEGLNNVEYILGYHPEDVSDIDLTIVSPGVPLDLPFIEKLKNSNVKIIGEVELAYRLSNNPIFIGITGTNGKTTTTSLVGEIFKGAKKDTYIVGNIGNPVIDTVDYADESSVLVTELSSFQLESIDTFRPKVSAILNITEDHLNRHNNIVIDIDGKQIVVLNKNNLSLPGDHNLENAMAAILMTYVVGIDLEVIKHVLTTFKGVEHRLEFVTNKNGIMFVNDSKGTNPDSTIKAIGSYERPIILIAGGMDKQSDFTEMMKCATKNVKALVLLGETADKIEASAKEQGLKNIIKVKAMKEAVSKSYELAESGDVVLLSPGCASWDMYPNFEARGLDFKENIYKL